MKGQSFSHLWFCPVLNLYVQFHWLMGNGVYEEALVCSLAGGNAKWITVSHITKQVLGWHWGRASDQRGVIPVFVLLHRVLHIQYLFFLCTLSIKFPWEVAAVVADTLTVSWILPTASHRVFFFSRKQSLQKKWTVWCHPWGQANPHGPPPSLLENKPYFRAQMHVPYWGTRQ